MQAIQRLTVNALVSGIVVGGLITIAFALTGRWPPREILLGASIGGLLSPLFWSWIAARRSPEE